MSPSLVNSPLRRVCHEFDQPLVPGRLIRRYKRFLADVALEDGSGVTVHCPNSGSMLASLEPDAPVYLSPADNPNRRTKYTWEMIFINHGWVGINTGIPNRLTALAAEMEALPIFQGAREVRREVKLGKHSRIDVLVELPDGPMFVEVKNVTLVRDGLAEFPDSVTSRGAKHLDELMKVVKEGGRAAMMYVVQRSDAEKFTPAKGIDPHYAELFWKAREVGVSMNVVEARVSPERICLERELEVVG